MANKQYKTEITLEDGTMATAFAPTIVSASRSTDIPAFYADWFFHRLNVRYSTWRNPFNGVKSHVSYQNTINLVFWSKSCPDLAIPRHAGEERHRLLHTIHS